MKSRITLCLLFVHGVIAALSLALTGCPNNAPGFCGDGLCRPAESESALTCASDCMAASCGDGSCSPGNGESCANCPGDCGGCGTPCGDGVCAATESCSSCPGDCGCRPGFFCSAAACEPDPAATWTLVIDSLRIDPTDYSGAAWDDFIGGGGPDPYILVRVGAATAAPARITGRADSLSTSFSSGNRVANLRADALERHLSFEMLEDDQPLTADDGVCLLTYRAPDLTWFEMRSQTATCVADASRRVSGMTIVWHLER